MTTTTKPKPSPRVVSVGGVRVDWRARPPAWVAANTAAVTVAGTGLVIGWVAWPLLAVAAAVIAAAAAVATPAPVTPGRVAWRTSAVLTAGLWSATVVAAGPVAWVWIAGAAAAAAGVGGTIVSARYTARRTEAAAIEAEARAAAQAAEANLTRRAGDVFRGENTDLDALAANWVARIERVANLTVAIPRIRVWDSGHGYDLYVELPPGGAGADDLTRCAQQLAADADLPRGCTVTVTEGAEGQRVAYIAVAHVNVLADDPDPVLDPTPVSIHDPIRLGQFADGAPTAVTLQQQSAIVVGMKGSGKTNLLRVLIRELMRRPDALIWCIDIGGGGGLVRDLMRPYYTGEVTRPPIDWPIVDAETARAALDGLLAAIPARKGIYDTTNLTPTSEVPQVIVITDELGAVPADIRMQLIQASDLGRASAVQLVSCGLRGIETYIPRDLVVQSAHAFVLGVARESEAQHVLDWQQRIKVSDIAGHPGRGLTFRRDEHDNIVGVEQFRAPHVVRDDTRDDLTDAAVTLNGLRPDLDEPTADIVNEQSGGRYARRFDLAATILWPGEHKPVARRDLITPTGDADVDAAHGDLADLTDRYADASLTDLMAVMEENAAALRDTTGGGEDGLDAPAEDLVDADGVAELDALLEGPGTTREHIAQAVLDAGESGTTPVDVETALAALGVRVTRRTVRRHLADLTQEGRVASPTEGRYVYVRGQ